MKSVLLLGLGVLCVACKPSFPTSTVHGADGGPVRDAAGDGDDQRDAGPIYPPPPEQNPWDDLAEIISADVTSFAAAMCGRYVDCGLYALAGDKEACTRGIIGLNDECDKSLEELALPELDACLAAITALDCATVQRLTTPPAACEPALVAIDKAIGHSAENGPCGTNVLCGHDLSCTSDGSKSCGKCIKLPEAGSACDAAGDCASGNFCDSQRKCEPLLADAMPCSNADECESAYCNASGVCSKPAVGDACSKSCYGGQCWPVCDLSLVCSAGKCESTPERDQACSTDLPCGSFLVCVDGKCKLPQACGHGNIGDPCTPNVLCSQDHYCNSSTRECSGFAKEKESCGLAGPFCDKGLVCSFDDFKCAPAEGIPGASCMHDSDCDTGHCVKNVCSAFGSGHDCESDQDCTSGVCDFKKCAEKHGC